jgi:hypothetical protein
MNKYLIEVNHFRYEIIWEDMQEKYMTCLRFGSQYPSLGNPPNARGPLATDISIKTAT